MIPELFGGDNEPGEVDETLELEAAWQAAREATRRNLLEGNTGAYWIETQLPSGRWTVELRGRRRARPMPSDGSGPSWFYVRLGDGGGGGGGDGGGGGGG